MKNKNLILLIAAGAAYWYFFMYKKKKQDLAITQPGGPEETPGSSKFFKDLDISNFSNYKNWQTIAPATESVSIVEQLKSFSAPMRELEHSQDEVYQTYYANQVSGVKRVGVPYTI
jgi:hypothetical protein